MQAILYMRENKQTNTSEGYYCELGTYKHRSSLTRNGRFQLIINFWLMQQQFKRIEIFFSNKTQARSYGKTSVHTISSVLACATISSVLAQNLWPFEVLGLYRTKTPATLPTESTIRSLNWQLSLYYVRASIHTFSQLVKWDG